VTSAVAILAENNFGDTRSGGLAGPMGLFIILLMAVATVLLIRNMNMRIRRLPDQFPAQGGPDQAVSDQAPPESHRTDSGVAESQAAESHEPERNNGHRRSQSGT
jgi:hypothetical protein